MDINMPIMDGNETTKKIKELYRKNQVKESLIFALSAYNQSQQTLETGYDAFIEKPISKEKIRK